MQAGGANRVTEENKIGAAQSPCEADDPSDMMTRMGNYLGSWLGLGSVPEHAGAMRPMWLIAFSGTLSPCSRALAAGHLSVKGQACKEVSVWCQFNASRVHSD